MKDEHNPIPGTPKNVSSFSANIFWKVSVCDKQDIRKVEWTVTLALRLAIYLEHSLQRSEYSD